MQCVSFKSCSGKYENFTPVGISEYRNEAGGIQRNTLCTQLLTAVEREDTR